MARPLRLEFPGASYHVTSRGDRREAIFEDDIDRQAFLNGLNVALTRFDAVLFAYCLMDNHYHLVVHAFGQFIKTDAAYKRRVHASLQSAA